VHIQGQVQYPFLCSYRSIYMTVPLDPSSKLIRFEVYLDAFSLFERD